MAMATCSSPPISGSATSKRRCAAGRCACARTRVASSISRSTGVPRSWCAAGCRRASARWTAWAASSSSASARRASTTWISPRSAPWIPAERMRRLDLENLERVFLYPTLGVLWIAECEDEELTQAYLRAYNRWIVDFCADSGGRLLPIAQLSLGDPAAAERELRRAAERRRARRVGAAVRDDPQAARPQGSPSRVRGRAGARAAARHPSLFRAQVVRAGALRRDHELALRVLHQRHGARRRATRVHVALPVRRLRAVSRAARRRARVGRRLDRLLARPHGRRLRVAAGPARARAAAGAAERLFPAPVLDLGRSGRDLARRR